MTEPTLTRDEARDLHRRYARRREGIRLDSRTASICLICGSPHVQPKPGEPHLMVCSNCGFSFMRYTCSACGSAVDGRDPLNPGCRQCGRRICTCGACCCSPG